MSKKKQIFISELQLKNLVGSIIQEQMVKAAVDNTKLAAPSLNTKKYACLDNEKSMAVQYSIGHGIEPIFVKYALGILGRESDYGKIYGAYAKKAAPEYIMNKLSEVVPGFRSLLQWAAKKRYDKENWVPSMGIAQMTPDVAEKYGINLEELMTLSGSLYAASRYLRDLYKITQKYYDIDQQSKIVYEKKLMLNPSSSGNAALDAAIMSYYLGSGKFNKSYCTTNNVEYMAPCESPNGVFKPFPKDSPNFILKVNKNQPVKNYIPTIKTKTGQGYISSTGYLKEVTTRAKGFACINK
jgi:hypothetical protein